MLAFPDHHDFRREADSLRNLGLPVVCTGKDSVKLAALDLPLPCFSLEVSARFFASLGAGEEPTNHALKDLEARKDALEKWGRTFVLLFPDESSYNKFDKKEFPNLPSNVVFGIDNGKQIQRAIAESMKLSNPNQLPIFIVADTFNRVVFESHGYTIGLGEQLLRVIHGL